MGGRTYCFGIEFNWNQFFFNERFDEDALGSVDAITGIDADSRTIERKITLPDSMIACWKCYIQILFTSSLPFLCFPSICEYFMVSEALLHAQQFKFSFQSISHI